MSIETVSAILDEFRAEVNNAVAATAFTSAGLRQLVDVFGRLDTVASNPDPVMHIGIGDPNSPAAEAYASWRMSEALVQVAPGGPVELRLSRQWVVLMYASWEHYRSRLAASHHCAEHDLSYPLLGDLRHLRNDVVHHRGLATQGNTGRCEVLRWFEPGELIHLRGLHYAEFVRTFPWEELAAGPE